MSAIAKFSEAMCRTLLGLALRYSRENSTCTKVNVGSALVCKDETVIMGSNHSVMGKGCLEGGCRRINLYGDASKEHRLPSDCDSIHSEVDVITKAAAKGFKLNGAHLYVTRYPCEACARAIINAGISRVFYGGNQRISDYTAQMFSYNGVVVGQISDWEDEEDVTY